MRWKYIYLVIGTRLLKVLKGKLGMLTILKIEITKLSISSAEQSELSFRVFRKMG